VVLGATGSGHVKGLMSITRSHARRNLKMENFCKGPAALRFGPSLSRSSLQLGHFMHDMQRMHTRFC
jgi:hypothetical protein